MLQHWLTQYQISVDRSRSALCSLAFLTKATKSLEGHEEASNVVAAIQMAKRLGPGASVVTLMVDSGLKYLSTDVYRSKGAP